jgi:hypothetical protein
VSAPTVAFVGSLVHRCPWLLPVFQEHLDDQEGEVLSHLFMADVERWAEQEVAAGRVGEGSQLACVLSIVDSELRGAGDTDVGEMIIVSFVEHLPYPGEPNGAIRELLPPALQGALWHRVDPPQEPRE